MSSFSLSIQDWDLSVPSRHKALIRYIKGEQSWDFFGTTILELKSLTCFSDAPASLALMIVTDGLTDSSKLEIVNFACLTVLSPPSLVSQVCLVSLVSLVTQVSLVILHNLQFFNFQLFVAHLWTDFQSCFDYMSIT